MLGPEPLVLDGRQALPDAQRLFDASEWGLPRPRGFFSVGWYGTAFSDERGSFGLVDPTGPLADLVGDIVELSYHPLRLRSHGVRTVRVYVIGSAQGLGSDIAITRRCYLSLEALSIDPITVSVGVVSRDVARLDQYDIYRAAVLADEPACYYRLAERGDVARDEVGGTNGAYVGVAGQMQPSLLPSGEAWSTTFAGGAGVVVPDNPATRIGAGSYTVECWARLTPGPEGWRGFFGQADEPVFAVIGRPGQWSFNAGGAAQVDGLRSWNVAEAENCHLVWTYEVSARAWGAQLAWRLWVNALGVDSGLYGLTTMRTNQAGLLIGAPMLIGTAPNKRATLGFYGRIQEFALYPRALSTEQIVTHYQRAQPWRES